ncbi:MAG: transketolase [Deltaproteobacteria bacterium]|jgi:transketolase|nr:transketolase [Deltaproteobacteria bacterium]
MMELSPKNVRMLSMLGQRGSIFGVALLEIAREHSDLMVLTADLALLSGLGKFQSQYPDQLLNLGIAEQNMLGVASGLAKEGNCVFVTTYATFLTMRAYEQIRDNLGYMQFNVKLVGASAGLAMGMSGNTHYAIEDLAIMRVVPNMTVLSPADAGEALKMAQAVCDIDGPVYIRLTGGLNCPVVYKEEFDFKIGRAQVLTEGSDLALIACGTMVAEALKAAELLRARGLEVTVINMHTVKPLDTEILDRVFAAHRAVVTIEEHSCLGGLGSAIAEYRCSFKSVAPLLIIGLPDAFSRADEQPFLLEQAGLTASRLADSADKFFNEVK